VNISAKIKIILKILWGVDLGPRYYQFMKKQTKKIECSVPLAYFLTLILVLNQLSYMGII